MASSQKTAHLKLNQWAEEDKPKRTDWNNDNQLVDQAVKKLEQQVGFHEENNALHVSKEEKDRWNGLSSLGMQSYVGTGSASQEIALGVTPTLAVVFSPGRSLFEEGSTVQCFGGAASVQGSNRGLTVIPGGIRVEQRGSSQVNPVSIKLNQANTHYIVFYWK